MNIYTYTCRYTYTYDAYIPSYINKTNTMLTYIHLSLSCSFILTRIHMIIFIFVNIYPYMYAYTYIHTYIGLLVYIPNIRMYILQTPIHRHYVKLTFSNRIYSHSYVYSLIYIYTHTLWTYKDIHTYPHTHKPTYIHNICVDLYIYKQLYLHTYKYNYILVILVHIRT